MAQSWDLAPILARRRTLSAESARLRQQVAVEIASLEAAASWVDRGISVVQSLRSWWPVAAAGVGLFLGRAGGRGLGKLGKLGKLWSVWRIIRQALAIWRQYFSSPSGQQEEA